MQEGVKLGSSEELESEKLCSFKNWLTTWLKLMEAIQFSQELGKEQEKETIYITKW